MTQYAYHLLHNQSHGKTEIERVGGSETSIYLPDNEDTEIILPIDFRDERTLIVFDGFISYGGLPRNSSMIYFEHLASLVAGSEHVPLAIKTYHRSKNRVFLVPDVYTIDNLFIGILQVYARLVRHFILLPSCRAVVFRYRPKSLSPQGVVIEVENGKVRFLTTTY